MGSKTKQARRTARKAATAADSPFADDGRVYCTTMRGVTVECLAIAGEIETQEQNIRAQIEWPEAPTYTFRAGGEDGDLITATHTVKTIQDPKTTPEEKQAWADYQAALAEAEAQLNRRMGEALPRLIALRGIRIVDAERLEAQWAEEHAWLGMEVPEDPRERAVHFFFSEVIGDMQRDTFAIVAGIYKASGYAQEVIEQVEASFRSALGRSRERADAETGAAQA